LRNLSLPLDKNKGAAAMPFKTAYVFVVSMDVEYGKEGLFNEVYDGEHIPLLLKVPGVRGAQRMKGEDFAIMLGGQRVEKKHEAARYTAVYEIDDPSVLLSREWAEAVETGRWPVEVRPFTKNRSHAIFKVM
jgi:hypothetical protein